MEYWEILRETLSRNISPLGVLHTDNLVFFLPPFHKSFFTSSPNLNWFFFLYFKIIKFFFFFYKKLGRPSLPRFVGRNTRRCRGSSQTSTRRTRCKIEKTKVGFESWFATVWTSSWTMDNWRNWCCIPWSLSWWSEKGNDGEKRVQKLKCTKKERKDSFISNLILL